MTIKKQENESFVQFGNVFETALLLDQSDHKNYPIKYYNLVNGLNLEFNKSNSYFCFIYEGNAEVIFNDDDSFYLKEGMYFSFSGNLVFKKGIFRAIIIEVIEQSGVYAINQFKSFFNIGKIEKKGRLKYIDGCSDSLLIPPVKLGDPCFNHLHFPQDIKQTQHTHPSDRIGIIYKGNGLCITPFGNLELSEKMIFVIKENCSGEKAIGLDNNFYLKGQHSFETFGNPMDVIAFHPDSDFGATDLNHPMINKTIVKGDSAKFQDDILTKKI